MIRKLIGSAEVVDGKAEYLWEIGEGTTPGKRKVYVTYVENDGYMVGEAWENAYIRRPTAIVLRDEEIIASCTMDSSEPEKVTLGAIVHSTTDMEYVTEGKVQFQVKREGSETFVNVGTPVSVVDGVAEYEYVIPELAQTTILVKALYLANQLYSASETESYETIHVRGKVSLSIDSLRTSPGATETITCHVANVNGSDIDLGEVNVYLDDRRINRVQSVSENTFQFNYKFPQDILSGEHELKIEYLQNDLFDYASSVSSVYVRTFVIIGDEVVYAPQTLEDENNNLLKGIAQIPITVTTLDGNSVPEGTVVFSCQDIVKNISLDADGSGNVSFTIPLGMNGGDEIPFTLEYLENDNYQSNSVTSNIIIKFRTNVEIEEFEGVLGERVTLRAFVTDENGEDVDGGEVTFEMGTNDENEEING